MQGKKIRRKSKIKDYRKKDLKSISDLYHPFKPKSLILNLINIKIK